MDGRLEKKMAAVCYVCDVCMYVLCLRCLPRASRPPPASKRIQLLWNYDLSSPWRQGCRGKYATRVARVAHALAITLAAGANTRRGNMASRPAHVR